MNGWLNDVHTFVTHREQCFCNKMSLIDGEEERKGRKHKREPESFDMPFRLPSNLNWWIAFVHKSNRTGVVWNPGKFCKITSFHTKHSCLVTLSPWKKQRVENWNVHIPFYISYPQRTPWCWLCSYLFRISADNLHNLHQLRFLMFVWSPVWALILIFSPKSLQVLVTKSY